MKGKRHALFCIYRFFRNILTFIRTRWYILKYRYSFVKIGKKIRIRSYFSVNSYDKGTLRINFDDGVYIDRMVSLRGTGNINIGKYTSIGEKTTILAEQEVTIGDYVQIAQNCVISDNDHVFNKKNTKIMHSGVNKQKITIQDNVWIGANATIVKGVTIGEGSVVAAGAVITKDVPPHSVAAGIPAKIIKQIDYK